MGYCIKNKISRKHVVPALIECCRVMLAYRYILYFVLRKPEWYQGNLIERSRDVAASLATVVGGLFTHVTNYAMRRPFVKSGKDNAGPLMRRKAYPYLLLFSSEDSTNEIDACRLTCMHAFLFSVNSYSPGYRPRCLRAS